MTVSVSLPPALLALFPAAPSNVEIEATRVDELMTALDARWPGMRSRLCDSTPAVRKHLAVYVDGERASLATPLRHGAEVFVMTRISGG